MNCKKGDMALVVGSPRNNGKVVTCLELLPAGSAFVDDAAGPLWRVDRPFTYTNDMLPGVTAAKNVAPDKVLRPLADKGPSVLAQEPIAPVATETAKQAAGAFAI